jgi:catechol 2,3-dioxygenase-like lactoylglutathione lyase family enzyme
LLNDLHHMTFVTGDLDRLIAFYERNVDARVTWDRTEEGGVRHAAIDVGPHTVLHPFQCRVSSRPAGRRCSIAVASTTSR